MNTILAILFVVFILALALTGIAFMLDSSEQARYERCKGIAELNGAEPNSAYVERFSSFCYAEVCEGNKCYTRTWKNNFMTGEFE